MKNQTVEKLWNIMICLGLAGLVVFFSMLFGMFLITAQEGSGHGYSGIEIGALCFFCLVTSFFMLRLSKGLKLFSFDLSFLTKKNLKIILIGTALTLGILIAETILINQNILIEQAGNPRTMAVLSKAPSLVIGVFILFLLQSWRKFSFVAGLSGWCLRISSFWVCLFPVWCIAWHFGPIRFGLRTDETARGADYYQDAHAFIDVAVLKLAID